MEKRQQIRLVSVLILAAVFGAGLMVGFALDRTALATPVAEVAEVTDGDDDERHERDREERRSMYAQVGELTDEQSARIDSVVEAFRAAGSQLREEQELEAEPWRRKWNGRFDSLVQATREDIKAVMTAEQAQRYDSLIADYEQRRAERRAERDSADARRD